MAHIIPVCARPPARYATGADFNLWLQRFELYVAEAGIRESMQEKELLSLLDDEPFRIASQIGLVAEVNPEVVKTSLREQFCPVGNELEWQLKLHERRQNSNEKLSEFAGSLRVLADKAYPDWEPKQRLEIAKNRFIQGVLISSTQLHLMRENPKSLEDAVKLANQRESLEEAQKQLHRSSHKPETLLIEEAPCNQSSITSTKDDFRELSRQIQRLSVEVEKLQMRGEHQRLQAGRKQSPVVCWNCGRQGHYRRDCRSKGRNFQIRRRPSLN